MKQSTILRMIGLVLLVLMLSSCYFSTPGIRWAGLSGGVSRGFSFLHINLMVASVTLKLGSPFGLGVYTMGKFGMEKFGITRPIGNLPGIHIQLFPVLQTITQQYKSAGIHILIISIGVGI